MYCICCDNLHLQVLLAGRGTLAGLPLSTGCWGNLLAEKEVIIAGWILTDNHLVKDNDWFLDYACTIIQSLNP